MNEEKLLSEKEEEEHDESGLDFSEELLSKVRSCADEKQLKEELGNYHANDLAKILPLLDERERKKLYILLGDEQTSEIFAYLDDPDVYVEELSAEKAADIVENMDADDAVDLLSELDESKKREIIELMEQSSAEDVRLISRYDEDEIGSAMTTNFVCIDKTLTVKQAMNSVVQQAADNDNISTVYVTENDGVFYGAIELRDLFIARSSTPLSEFIATSYPFLYAHEKISDCLERIKSYAEDSLPVLDADNRLIGALTSSNVIDVVDDEMNEDYAKLAGLSGEEEEDDGVFKSLFKRLPWILALLLMSLAVSALIGLFENVIAALPLLVCFQSLVLDMGGNSGTQALAVTLQQMNDERTQSPAKIIFRETRVAFLGGLVLAVVSFLLLGVYMLLFKNQSPEAAFSASACISGALIAAMTVSGCCGSAVPLFFKKLKLDPAVASGPLITTINDLVSALAFYGIAWLFLIYL